MRCGRMLRAVRARRQESSRGSVVATYRRAATGSLGLSEERSEVLPVDVTVTENGCEEARPNRLT